MHYNKRKSDWREKVNPIFPLAIHFGKALFSLFRSLGELVITACEQAIPLLPQGPSDLPDVDISCWAKRLQNEPELAWLSDEKVLRAVAKVVSRFKCVPKADLFKHFAKPHWWMMQDSWWEFLQDEGGRLESFLNVLAILHLNLPLPELTRQVPDDPALHSKLFQNTSGGTSDNRSVKILETNLVLPLKDRATKIVGRALLQRGDPPGYLLGLRMALFLGWDFGLSELSVQELHDFLVQLTIIRKYYDLENLRKYRDRLRRLIRSASNQSLPAGGICPKGKILG